MQIGDTYEYKNVVTKEITAGALGSGGLDIFATPFLICWMEAAAYYSAYNGRMNPVAYYSGVSFSEPSDKYTEENKQTSWYRDTH